MITCSTFNTNGRLGNMLFRYASLIGLARKHNTELKLPEWPYAKYFEGEFPEGEIESKEIIEVRESVFNYIPEWPPIKENEHVDIWGYLQSKKYWEHCEDDVIHALTFKTEFVDQVRAQFNGAFDKPTIAISIRRGDYVNNSNYAQLPISSYYICALLEHFQDWRNHNLIIFSDDIPYCRVHFDCLPNVFFSENNSDIEDICLMSLCDNFIISNSTFSWWGAYLSKNKSKKIVRPAYHFAGKLLQRNDWKDLYPPEWTIFSHISYTTENKKIDLSDVTFTIPVSYDHQDRKENIDLCIAILRRNFNTNISVYEQGDESKFEYLIEHSYLIDSYNYTPAKKFHRTKMLNIMALEANSKFIFNWDADIFIAPLQILEAVNQLRNGADMVYPYGWAFARMPRNTWFVKVRDYEDVGMVGDTKFNGMNNGDAVSLGGAVGFNRQRFIEGGMENENFISYGAEDVERRVRFEKLGYRIERTIGATMYHMNHYVGPNSCRKHDDFENNNKEYDKVNAMTKDELLEYIKTWPWLK